MTSLDLHSLDFGKWTRCVQGIAYFQGRGRLDKVVTIEELQELIERGIELRREGKIRNYDKWAHTMCMLKKMRREMASQTHQTNLVK